MTGESVKPVRLGSIAQFRRSIGSGGICVGTDCGLIPLEPAGFGASLPVPLVVLVGVLVGALVGTELGDPVGVGAMADGAFVGAPVGAGGASVSSVVGAADAVGTGLGLGLGRGVAGAAFAIAVVAAGSSGMADEEPLATPDVVIKVTAPDGVPASVLASIGESPLALAGIEIGTSVYESTGAPDSVAAVLALWAAGTLGG